MIKIRKKFIYPKSGNDLEYLAASLVPLMHASALVLIPVIAEQ